jgi:hypothetical protein
MSEVRLPVAGYQQKQLESYVCPPACQQRETVLSVGKSKHSVVLCNTNSSSAMHHTPLHTCESCSERDTGHQPAVQQQQKAGMAHWPAACSHCTVQQQNIHLPPQPAVWQAPAWL